MFLSRVKNEVVKLACAAGLATVMAVSVMSPATVEAANSTGSVVTPAYWGYAQDCDLWICQNLWRTAHGYGYWTSTLRCYYSCEWDITPIQVEQLLYDPNLTVKGCCGPFTSTQQMDIFDRNGTKRYSKIWVGNSGLCWQSMYDPTNYDHFGGCNRGFFWVPYEGTPPARGVLYLGINPSTPGGWGYTSGQFWLY